MSPYGNGFRNTSQRVSNKRKKINEFIVDETQIKVGSQYIWLWVAIEPKHRQILQIDISLKEQCLLERFISSLINRYGKHSVSTDGGTWYPQA